MTRKKFIPEDGKWMPYDEVDSQALAEAVYEDVGARFPLNFNDGYPIVDDRDLPDGVKLNDVKKALKKYHPRS